MRYNWEEMPLVEIADLTVGFVGTMAKHYTESGVKFLRSMNIDPFSINDKDMKFISAEFNEKIKKSQLKKDDVVIVRTGKPGACAVIPDIQDVWNCSDLVIIRPDQTKVVPLYLAAYINLASGVINSRLVGAVQQHFNVGAAKQMMIPLPNLVTQRQIAGIVGNINEKIAINEEINNNLEEQAQAIFKSWFVNFDLTDGAMPLNWIEQSLEEVSTLSAGGDKPKNVSKVQTNEYPYPIFSNGISDEGLYGYTDISKIEEESVTVSARGTIGFVCLRHTPYVPIVRLVSVIPNTNVVSAKYLYLCLKNMNISGTGTTQQQLTVPSFKKTTILVPAFEYMAKFTEAVNPLFETIWHNQEENQRLSSLRDSLLPKLMSGEIDVSDIDL